MKRKDPTSGFPFTRYLIRTGTFRASPLCVIDAGSRDGVEAVWNVYGDQVNLIGFDPDAEHCERLNQAAGKSSSKTETYYPVALHRDKKLRTLHVTTGKYSSSLLQVNWDLVSRFPHSQVGTVTHTEDVQTTDLDSFMQEKSLTYCDFMKLDVEGVELEVLEGAERLLSNSLLGLSVEVFFQPYHHKRPLFGDVDRWLRKHGFVLFDFLHTEKWCRNTRATSDGSPW